MEKAVGFERYHLVGHSLGGAIVQEIALGSPESLFSLTLEDTGPLASIPGNAQLGQSGAPDKSLLPKAKGWRG